MPNWVCIGFKVMGDPQELDRFKQTMFRTIRKAGAAPGDAETLEVIFDFNGVIPMPSEAELHHYEDWAVRHWGTKWNAQYLQMSPEGEGFVHFQFDTAWDFPTPVFEALAIEFPGLIFAGSAFEDNNAFELAGEFNGENSWGPTKIDWGDVNDGEDGK